MTDQATETAERFWNVPPEADGLRLDGFIRRCLPHLSRRALEEAVRERLFRVNGKVARKGARLTEGDTVSFIGTAAWLAETPQPTAGLHIPIIYEDAVLLVVNKPAGISTHGFTGRESATVANFLAAARPELCRVGVSAWEPGLVHRLDRETSGALLIAKTQPAFEHLRQQFRRRQVRKQYLALVCGQTEANGSICYPLLHDPRDRRRMRVVVDTAGRGSTRKSWRAETHFRKLGEAAGMTLLDIEMTTGVTHQIRAHLAAVGHPIAGDALYGARESRAYGLPRHFLHARSLGFIHPQHGDTVEVDAELSGDLQDALADLGLTY